MSWKKSALVSSQILRLFVTILTTDYKYSRRNMLNFTQQLEATLSQKQKTFSGYYLDFWNVHEIFNIFEKTMSILALFFSKIIHSKRDGNLNV